MTRVVVTGEQGIVTQTVRVGPAVLERPQVWNDLPRLAAMLRNAGLEVTELEPTAAAGAIPEPDCWVLSDLPFAATVASGLYERLSDQDRRAGLLLLGGALSLAGQQGVAGWAGAEPAQLLPVVVGREDDAIEAPNGLRLVAAAESLPAMMDALADAPMVYGYNKVAATPDATVVARFENGDLAIVVDRGRRSAVFTSDLMPHWGPDFEHWSGLSVFVRTLVGLVTE